MPTAIAPSRASSTRVARGRLAIAADARATLVSLLGGDRRASRNEIRKLALYAQGKDRVTLDDVVAVVAEPRAGARSRHRRDIRRAPR